MPLPTTPYSLPGYLLLLLLLLLLLVLGTTIPPSILLCVYYIRIFYCILTKILSFAVSLPFTTVDGRNPKQPPVTYKTPVNNGILTTNLNWWVCRISGCHQQLESFPGSNPWIFEKKTSFWTSENPSPNDTSSWKNDQWFILPEPNPICCATSPQGYQAWELYVGSWIKAVPWEQHRFRRFRQHPWG